MKTHFPEWEYDNETYYLSCLLHDIGTADRFLSTTKMSFEFKGAIIARDLIISKGGHGDQADSVCEAIVRHQDIFVKGFVVPPSLVLRERLSLVDTGAILR